MNNYQRTTKLINMKKILCPVNFTDTALNAVEYASNLANLHQGSLTLFHVVTNKEYNEILQKGKGDLEDQMAKGSGELEDQIQSLCREISLSYTEMNCQVNIGYGSLSNAIKDYARKGKYDLIVMGNDGVRNVTEAMDGSSIVKVIEQAPCPVLCVPKQADFQGLQKVVYGTEFKSADSGALHHLELMLEPLGSHIDVVHISKSSEKEVRDKNRAKMEELKSYLIYPNVQYHLKENKKSIRLGLDDFMEEVKAELLVMLTHQRGFFERVFQESNFKNMSYFADYPLLVYLEENLIKK